MLGSKYLAATYALFSVSLLASGVISVVFSQVFHKTDVLLNMVFSSSALTGASLLRTLALAVTRCQVDLPLATRVFLIRCGYALI